MYFVYICYLESITLKYLNLQCFIMLFGVLINANYQIINTKRLTFFTHADITSKNVYMIFFPPVLLIKPLIATPHLALNLRKILINLLVLLLTSFSPHQSASRLAAPRQVSGPRPRPRQQTHRHRP